MKRSIRLTNSRTVRKEPRRMALEQGVDAYRASEVFGWPLARGLRATSRDDHRLRTLRQFGRVTAGSRGSGGLLWAGGWRSEHEKRACRCREEFHAGSFSKAMSKAREVERS